jgi:hypothetical protein
MNGPFPKHERQFERHDTTPASGEYVSPGHFLDSVANFSVENVAHLTASPEHSVLVEEAVKSINMSLETKRAPSPVAVMVGPEEDPIEAAKAIGASTSLYTREFTIVDMREAIVSNRQTDATIERLKRLNKHEWLRWVFEVKPHATSSKSQVQRMDSISQEISKAKVPVIEVIEIDPEAAEPNDFPAQQIGKLIILADRQGIISRKDHDQSS